MYTSRPMTEAEFEAGDSERECPYCGDLYCEGCPECGVCLALDCECDTDG